MDEEETKVNFPFKNMVPDCQVSIPRQPSKEERELHELTHLPYRDWSDFCIATKARDDHQRVVDQSVEERRSIFWAQLDYAYGRSSLWGKQQG